jgi:hypothetical protein
LQQVFLSFMALDAAADHHADEVIRQALTIAKQKGARVATLGLSPQNPISSRLRRSLRASIYRSCIETVHWRDGVLPVLDGRPPQPEVGLL